MQVPAPFDYERATSVDHAISLLERLGGNARLLAGGHSLIPMMKLRLTDLEYLIDINDLHDELGYVRVGVDEVRIGAMTRHRELLESAELAAVFPIFADADVGRYTTTDNVTWLATLDRVPYEAADKTGRNEKFGDELQ